MFLDVLGVINKVDNLSVSRLNKADSCSQPSQGEEERNRHPSVITFMQVIFSIKFG